MHSSPDSSFRQTFVTIVSGLPRSGTSMMMQMLDAGGVPPLTDHQRTADRDNPRGYYEWEWAKKLPTGDVDWVEEARGKAVKVISALLQHLPPDHEYRVLMMRRRMEEVLASQQRMLEHRQEESRVDDGTLAEIYRNHLGEVERWMEEQPNLRFLTIDYNTLLDNPAPQIESIDRFLGGGLDRAAMTAVVDRDLYRQRKA